MATMNRAYTARTSIDLTEVITLEDGDIYCLPYGALSIHILSGAAWVTSQAEDHVLETGDPFQIARQSHAVLISALDHQPLCFELRKI